MKGFLCVLVCVATLAAHTRAQFGGGGGGAGGGGAGGGGTNPGAGAGGTACLGHPDPNATPVVPIEDNGPGRCMSEWTEYRGNCYLYDSASLEPRPTPASPYILNRNEGITQPAANIACSQLHPNASLVTINDQLESAFLFDWAVRSMVEPRPVWIGLHAHPVQAPNAIPFYEWQWYNGEVYNFTNWETPQTGAAPPLFGYGAVLFDVDIVQQLPNQVEIGPRWAVEEQAHIEVYAMICEYPLNGSAVVYAPAMPAATEAATTMDAGTTAGMAAATTQAATTPAAATTAAGPVMLNNPANIWGGKPMFGGSRLHEVPRRQNNGPANYRMGPYYAVQP